MVEQIDRAVGRVIKALREEALYEETAVLLLSDHGELLGDHGLWFKGPFLYEGLINVPLLLVDHCRRKAVSERLVSLVDIVPSVCDLLRTDTPPWVDGSSVYEEKEKRRGCLVEYRNGYREQGRDFTVCAFVTDTDKLIRYDDGSCEFTDFAADPEERENMAGRITYQERVKAREAELLSTLMRASGNRFEQISPN